MPIGHHGDWIYETYCQIRDCHQREGLKVGQIASALGLDARTVAHWIDDPRYRPRRSAPWASKLDPYKPLVKKWLQAHPLTAQQVFQRLREEGFEGGYTIVKDYVRLVRPRRNPAFLTLNLAPGECAQVDWGHYGLRAVGETRRKLLLHHAETGFLPYILNRVASLRQSGIEIQIRVIIISVLCVPHREWPCSIVFGLSS